MLLIVHGGAGQGRPSKAALKALSGALSGGYEILLKGGCALDSVIAAITSLEDSGIFNAGTGGNVQFDGIRRLDASVMEGRNLKAGAVAGLVGIRNPIKAARLIMDLPHVMMAGDGARKIAEGHCLAPLPEPDGRSMEKMMNARRNAGVLSRLYKRYFSTVGAVALDADGDLAAGASTGGIRAMLPGRVGDTPVMGAGIYADNSLGAVACTGDGEVILRLSLAKEICMNMRGNGPSSAGRSSLRKILKMGGEAGVITAGRSGRFGILHTTKYMASGYANSRGAVVREGFHRIHS